MTQPDPQPVVAAAAKRQIERNTRTRILSTMLLLPPIAFATVIGSTAFVVMACIIFGLGALELAAIVTDRRLGMTGFVSALGVLALALSLVYSGVPLAALVGVGSAGVLTLMAWRQRWREPETAHTLAALLALLLGLALVMWLGISVRQRPDGLLWWVLMLVATFGTDTLAFAGGRAYGRTPLLPLWSPKKTVEGTLTGMIGAAVLGVLVLAYFQVSGSAALWIVVGAPVAAVLGDLIESRFKRAYGVKDSAIEGLNFVPGHGGILDRIDSLSLVVLYAGTVLMLSPS
ncbi:MAG: phosphatidate cytidylyltransferase [Armatimonadetes bacterium]|nr:phosphatidate cytidylyltransferase [Anaerolineae bacterium]